MEGRPSTRIKLSEALNLLCDQTRSLPESSSVRFAVRFFFVGVPLSESGFSLLDNCLIKVVWLLLETEFKLITRFADSSTAVFTDAGPSSSAHFSYFVLLAFDLLQRSCRLLQRHFLLGLLLRLKGCLLLLVGLDRILFTESCCCFQFFLLCFCYCRHQVVKLRYLVFFNGLQSLHGCVVKLAQLVHQTE